MTAIATDSLLDELMKTEGKAEIINGKIVQLMSTGKKPGRAALRIAASLLNYEETVGGGAAYGDNIGFVCDLPNRRSFSPDAAFYVGSDSDTETDAMKFLPQAPIFAVEVRSENDYGRRAERDITAKIADYFAAGTLVVWDVDLINEEVVAKYSVDKPNEPQVFKRGDVANAEPAVPGWTMPVNALFAPTKS